MTVYVVEMHDNEGNSVVVRVFRSFSDAWQFVATSEFPDVYTITEYVAE